MKLPFAMHYPTTTTFLQLEWNHPILKEDWHAMALDKLKALKKKV